MCVPVIVRKPSLSNDEKEIREEMNIQEMVIRDLTKLCQKYYDDYITYKTLYIERGLEEYRERMIEYSIQYKQCIIELVDIRVL